MSIGKIVQVIGAVVDIEFPRDEMPKVYDALVLEKDVRLTKPAKSVKKNVCRSIVQLRSSTN